MHNKNSKSIKKYLFFFSSIILISLSCIDKNEAKKTITEDKVLAENKIVRDSIYYFKANPEQGFNFGYFLFVPKDFEIKKYNYLLIENTNTGPSDTLQIHIDRAKDEVLTYSMGNQIARKMKVLFLMPTFPRPFTEWQYYTHAFDSDTFTAKGKSFENIDQQLLAMFYDAQKQLKEFGITIQPKFFLTGFSASGTFANRFAMLHPEKIQAVAAGGLNGIAILPLDSLNGKRLDFPLGKANVRQVTGKEINLEQFKNLPQFWFMGENDTNDAVEYDDGYTENERQIVYEEINKKMMPDRWNFVSDIYERQGINAKFITYKGVGHGTDGKIKDDIIDFFNNNSKR